LLGLACGDAVGTTVEFSPRGSFSPLTDMVGGGPFGLPLGAWTDDTSMALCLATSLIEAGKFDLTDQIQRYCRWYEEGYLGSIDRCFDIGNTTRAALQRFRREGNPEAGSTDQHSAGNGSIMRLAPVVLNAYPNRITARLLAAESSKTTHRAEECLNACRFLAEVLCRALSGMPRDEALIDYDVGSFGTDKVKALASGVWKHKTREQIRGTGYVIDTLEAALWCCWQTDNFRDAVLLAANLGDDADTTAAVVGQIAGAMYGESGIPDQWLKKLVMADGIRVLANQLYDRRSREHRLEIRQFLKPEALRRLPEFVELLRDSVEHGSSIGFLLPFNEASATEFWQGNLNELPASADVVLGQFNTARFCFIAEEDNRLVGTAQLSLAPRENSRHRAEVQKLIVHSSARRQGIARRLLQQIESFAAIVLRRYLLVLDTETDCPAAQLYESLGWQLVGKIPRFAANTAGKLVECSLYYKELKPANFETQPGAS
jgi:ADP-ribosyl-[dinitrogen reductase] hydrolase